MSTKKLQIIDSLIKEAQNADTLDGKHADEFAAASDVEALQSKVGDTSVSEQISTALTSKSDTGHTHDDRYYTESEVDTKLSGKSDTSHKHDGVYAATSHGNHVPATETANNAKFLRNDNTWQTITPANIGAAASSHGTHVSYDATAPLMDGTTSAGTASTVSRSDHRHPTDTSRASASDLTALRGLVGDTAVSQQISTAIASKVDDYTIRLYNGTGGNPKPVKFLTINYSNCDSNNGVMVKVGMVSGHGNGISYTFLQDVIINVSYTGTISADNFKYYGQEVADNGVTRQYGDIFWIHDTTNKVVDFYCLMGQYADVKMMPYKRLNSSSGGTVTQHTSCTVYSSGTKVWANNSDIALMSDLSLLDARLSALEASVVATHSGAEAPVSTLGEDGDLYLVTE